jgi:hypothetical protein
VVDKQCLCTMWLPIGLWIPKAVGSRGLAPRFLLECGTLGTCIFLAWSLVLHEPYNGSTVVGSGLSDISDPV